jgi:hypothetical protein
VRVGSSVPGRPAHLPADATEQVLTLDRGGGPDRLEVCQRPRLWFTRPLDASVLSTRWTVCYAIANKQSKTAALKLKIAEPAGVPVLVTVFCYRDLDIFGADADFSEAGH